MTIQIQDIDRNLLKSIILEVFTGNKDLFKEVVSENRDLFREIMSEAILEQKNSVSKPKSALSEFEMSIVKDIMEEDKEVLKKLAQ